MATHFTLTAYHARPGEVADRSQAAPVALTKRNRPYSYVVSADWFDRAERALKEAHGDRRAVQADDLSEADREFIDRHGPAADEVEDDTWRD